MTRFRVLLHDYHSHVTWFVTILLLLLRIPYSIAIIYLVPVENQIGAAYYGVLTYILILFLIWWERDRLAEFHLDKPAIFLILVFRPIQTLILAYWRIDTPLAFPNIPSLVIWVAAIALAIWLWRGRLRIVAISMSVWGWLTTGIVLGICFSIVENFIPFRSMLGNQSPLSFALMESVSLNLLYHVGFAPISEEPLFRGFLWGLLRQRKWSDARIMVFQTLLFTIAHVYHAQQSPWLFWVFVPLAALFFGWLTLRSRSIGPAMLAHGMINGSAYILIVRFISGIIASLKNG